MVLDATCLLVISARNTECMVYIMYAPVCFYKISHFLFIFFMLLRYFLKNFNVLLWGVSLSLGLVLVQENTQFCDFKNAWFM